MLYDPKWEVKTKPSLAGLITWLERHPSELEYNWSDCQGACLIGQYLTSCSIKNDEPNLYFEVQGGFQTQIDSQIFIALDRPHTFGGALERARSMAEYLSVSTPD